MYKIILITLSLLLISCSQQSQKSPLKVTFGAASATFTGNLIVFGRNTDGHSFIREVSSSDSKISLELENGTWSFGSIGWDGSSSNFENTSYCDSLDSIKLDGDEVPIDLNVTTAKCSLPFYGGQTDVNGFKPLKFTSCLGIKYYLLNQGSDAAPGNLICNGTDDILNGGAKSARISIISGEFISGEVSQSYGDISSQCFSFSDSQSITDLRLPFGSTSFSLPYKIETFSELGCSNADLADVYVYKNGFTQISDGQIGGASPDTSEINVTLHADTCTGDQLTNQPFATGSSTAQTYLICTKQQFENIAKGSGLCPTETAGLPTMDCESSATYIIGKDIDFLGSNTTIVNTFDGNLRGQGFTLAAGSEPLFEEISPNSTNQSRISDLNIIEFNINYANNSSDINLGILSKAINSTGSGQTIEIDNITIKDSSIVSSSKDFGYSVGGAIGLVNYSSASGDNEYLEIRKSSFNINLLTDSADVNVGGIIGKTQGGVNKSIRLEENKVGSLESPMAMSTKWKTGGLIGHAEDTQVDFGNTAYVTITAIEKAGGLVGEAKNLSIKNSYAKIEIIPGASPATYFGGAVGTVTNDNDLEINGVATNLTIEHPTYLVNKVGGLVGSFSSSSGGNLFINNSRGVINSEVDGNYQGGLVGSITTELTSPNEMIQNSVSMGSIGVPADSTISSNNKRGGLLGYAKGVSVKRSIADIDIYGYKVLGGAIGESSDYVKLEEIYIYTDIHNAGGSAPYQVGGIIGESTGISFGASISGVLSDVDLYGYPSCFADNTDNCAAAIGKSNLATTLLSLQDSIISAYSQNDGDANTHDLEHISEGDSNLIAGLTSNTISSDFSTDCNDMQSSPTSLSEKFDYIDGQCRLVFQDKWKKLGYNTQENYYLSGGVLEPFPLYNHTDWNSIGTDAFLVTKSYRLENDIDFLGQTFTSIGTNASTQIENIFRGSIIPNGYRLKNINFTIPNTAIPSGAVTSGGLFPLVEGANIGFEDDPLVIENLNLITPSNWNMGVIGEASGTNISIIVENGSITGTSSGIVGGIVGYAKSNVQIKNSAFNGVIDIPTGNAVGGLIGACQSAMSGNSIQESYVHLSAIKGFTKVGGLVGDTDTSSNFRIEDSYARIGFISASDAGPLVAGLVGQSGAAITIENSFADLGAASGIQADFTQIANGTAGTINNVAFVGTGYTASANHMASAVVVDNAALLADGSLSFDSEDTWYFSNGLLFLDWEINGHKND